jgi:iron(III) transport system ATP-binding protein
MSEPCLEMIGLRQQFGATVAVADVSLSAFPGEILCLLGHSGCGKTTLLRAAAGLEQPDAGVVRLNGRDVVRPGLFVPPEQRGVGMMFQDYALFPHLSVLDNVRFGLTRLPAAKAHTVAMEALVRVGLAHYAHDYPHVLSGGQQQRVALARALAPHPEILLMDEPFSNLDQRMRERIRDETMALLREKGTTALVVTHDPAEAMLISDRVALMEMGHIVQIGTPGELYRRPATLFAARYFCDLNEVTGEIVDGRVETVLGTFSAEGLRDGRCVVCIRPQAVVLVGQGIAATVERNRFTGEADLLTFRPQGLDGVLEARLPPGTGPEPGSQAHLAIDPSGVMVFATN